MTLDDANKKKLVKKGFRFRYPSWKTIWEVKEVVKRGAIVDMIQESGHHHLCEWAEEIKPV